MKNISNNILEHTLNKGEILIINVPGGRVFITVGPGKYNNPPADTTRIFMQPYNGYTSENYNNCLWCTKNPSEL